MNLGDLQAAVDRRTGMFMDSAAQVGFINAALDEIVTARDWPWLTTTQTLQGDGTTISWPLPLRWLRTRHVTVSGQSEARYINIGDMDHFANYQDTPGRYAFSIDGANIIIRAAMVATTSAMHRYIQDEPLLAGASDTPLLPDRFSQAVVVRASRITAERMGDAKLTAVLTAETALWDRRMRDEQEVTRGQRRIRVRNGFGWY